MFTLARMAHTDRSRVVPDRSGRKQTWVGHPTTKRKQSKTLRRSVVPETQGKLRIHLLGGGSTANVCGLQRLIWPTRDRPSSFFLTVASLLWLATSIFFALQVPPFSRVKKNR